MKTILKSSVLLLLSILLIQCDNNNEITTENCTLATLTNNAANTGEEQMNVSYQAGNIIQLTGNTLKYIYTYNAQGLLHTKVLEETISTTNADITKVTYTYNSTGKIIQEYYEYMVGGTFQYYAKLEYTYNTQNQIVSANFYNDEAGIDTFQGTSNYTYTGDNITKIEFESNDADTTVDYVYEYTIDTTKNNPIHTISQQFYAMDNYLDDDDAQIFYPIYNNKNVVTAIKETETGYPSTTNYLTYLTTTSPQGNSLLSEIKIDNASYYKFSYNCN